MLKENYVKTGEITTHYWEAGEGEPVIMLHGGGAGADAYGNFAKIMESFASQGYRALAYDAVGFGKTDKPDPNTYEYSWANRSGQLLQFIEELNLKGVTLIGNSMGGATSLVATLRKPEQIQRLILMGSGGECF